MVCTDAQKRNARKWRIKNPDKVKKIGEIYRKKNREKINYKSRTLYDRTNCKNKKGYVQRYNLKRKVELCMYLGGMECVNCKFTDIRALQFDHVNNNGAELRKTIGYATVSYYIRHLDEAKKDLQVLCANCNWIKEYKRRNN